MQPDPEDSHGPENFVPFVNIILGTWMLIAPFVMRYPRYGQVNTFACGAFITGFALWGLYIKPLRYVNAGIAIWLFIATLALPHTPDTLMHNLMIALIVFVAAMFGTRDVARFPPPPRESFSSR